MARAPRFVSQTRGSFVLLPCFSFPSPATHSNASKKISLEYLGQQELAGGTNPPSVALWIRTPSLRKATNHKHVSAASIQKPYNQERLPKNLFNRPATPDHVVQAKPLGMTKALEVKTPIPWMGLARNRALMQRSKVESPVCGY